MSLQHSYGKLYIKKKTFEQWLVLVVLFLPFCFGLFFEIFSLPNFIRYILDLSVIYFSMVFLIRANVVLRRNLIPLAAVTVVFFVYTLLCYCFNFQSPFYYLWGLRNNFRFYMAFFAFAVFMDEDAANAVLKIFDFLFWVNIAVSVFQFVVLGISQDDLGGLFGSTGGTNAYTLIFFVIIICKSLLCTFNGTEKVGLCISKCVASLVVAAMAEMKFYFFVFIFILAITSLLTKFSGRKFVILIIASIGVALGSMLLTYFFDEFEGFMTLQGVWNSATKEHYSSQDDINRFSAISILTKDYITKPLQQIFGLGLGNCDVSEVPIFNSVFYQKYSFLHYTWFSSAMLFLETGYIGLVIYLLFFALCFRNAYLQLKAKTGNKLYCQMAIVISLICVILFFYNSTLRIEAGYMVYFILALPFLPIFRRSDVC